jgi:queuosine precursor transporter
MQPTQSKRYRYLDAITAAFVVVLLCSNLIGAAKVGTAFGLEFSIAVLFFPASYLFGDILTEVYGYARARRVVWIGFGAMGFASLMSWLTVVFPPAADWPHQAAYETVFGLVPRITVASLAAFWCGAFVNSFVLAKLKVATGGKALYARTIGSTIAGEAIDTVLFFGIAFYGVWDLKLLLSVALTEYVLKVLWEVLATPFTYKLVAALKRAESEDIYDRGTDFTPFSVRA